MSAEHSKKEYVKVYFMLVILFTISVCGPMLEIPTLTLITAFGIAFVKAFLVIKHFMHLTIEKRFVTYFLVAMVLASVLFVAGIAADTMTPGGQNWIRL